MSFQDLLYDVAEGIATITLNRPESLNAFTDVMLRSWVDALSEAQADPEVKVIIITGAGRAFCAGGDVKAMGSGQPFPGAAESKPTALSRKNNLWETVHRVALKLEDVDKPVIAAVNGPAVGAGCDMTLMCDLRFASTTAVFTEGYVNVGLVPGDGGAYFLPRIVGVSKALELLWTGRPVKAEEAERLGLVTKVVEPEALISETRAFAAKLAAGPQTAIRLIKRAVYQAQRVDLRTHLDQISSHMAVVMDTADHREAVQAFIEKRKPQFGKE